MTSMHFPENVSLNFFAEPQSPQQNTVSLKSNPPVFALNNQKISFLQPQLRREGELKVPLCRLDSSPRTPMKSRLDPTAAPFHHFKLNNHNRNMQSNRTVGDESVAQLPGLANDNVAQTTENFDKGPAPHENLFEPYEGKFSNLDDSHCTKPQICYSKSKEEEICPDWFNSFTDWVDHLEVDGDPPRLDVELPSPLNHDPVFKYSAAVYNHVGEAAEPYSQTYSQFNDPCFKPQPSVFSHANSFLEDEIWPESRFSSLSRKQSSDMSVLSPVSTSNNFALQSSSSQSSLSSSISPSNHNRVSIDSVFAPQVSASYLSWADVTRSSEALVDPVQPQSTASRNLIPEFDSSIHNSNILMSMNSQNTTFAPTFMKALEPPVKTSPPVSAHQSPAGVSSTPNPYNNLAYTTHSRNFQCSNPYSAVASSTGGAMARSHLTPSTSRPHQLPSTNNWPPLSKAHQNRQTSHQPAMLSPVSPSNVIAPPPHHSRMTCSRSSNSQINLLNSNNSGSLNTASNNTSGIIPAVVMKGIKNKDPLKPGDWICPNSGCRFHNFARRTSCVACGTSDKNAGRF